MAFRITSVILFFVTIEWLGSAVDSKSSKCERITIPMCQDMPYNLTRMPNLMGHKDQSEAAIQVHEFIPLVEIGCSKNLKFFLCSLYAPMCTEQIDIPIPSCQSICEDVKSRCLPVLRQFNFNWPHMLNCSRLPVPKDGLCMEPNITESKAHKHHYSSLPSKPSDSKSSSEKDTKEIMNSIESMHPFLYPQRRDEANSQSSYNPSLKPSIRLDAFDMSYHMNGDNSHANGKTSKNDNKCYPEFAYIPIAGQHFNQSSGVCAPKCGKDILFTRKDKNFVEIWMCVWASISFMATLFTVLTFWIDSQRFRYPEKPIIFLSMCFCISSAAYLIRIYTGPEFISCDKSDSGEHHITLEGLDNAGCMIVFLLLYYFGMSASMWWVVLTTAWYLAAVRKWKHEAIEAKASVFHVFSWTTPAILTIIVLTLRHVDGDELTGLCYVGHQDPNALLYFVIIPLCVFSTFGVLVLVLGFILKTPMPSDLRYDDQSNEKSNRLIVRIGVFSTFYAIPVICVIGCHIYEYKLSAEWRETALDRSRVCQDTNAISSCRLSDSIPLKEIFVLKIFMSLVLGISTGIWVWSNRTWASWTHFCQSTFGRRPRRNFKSGTSGVKCPPVSPGSQYLPVQQQHQTPSSSVVSIQRNPQFNHISRQQPYYHSYASLKSQRHTHRPHRKHRTDNSITHV